MKSQYRFKLEMMLLRLLREWGPIVVIVVAIMFLSLDVDASVING